MSDFGPVLADYRKTYGVSQYRLAERMDCCHSYISRVETGQREPSREFIERLVEVLGLTLHEGNVFRLAAGFAPVYTKGVRI
jgi:transcriptional regulator with XRE-family HTH domain